MADFFRQVYEGQEVSAVEETELRAYLRGLGQYVQSLMTGTRKGPISHWVQILEDNAALGTDGNRYKYGWSAFTVGGTNHQTLTLIDGIDGTSTDNYAICAEELMNDGTTGAADPVKNTVARLWFFTTTDGKTVPIFSTGGGGRSPPVGQFLGMVYAVVATNTGGWVFESTHAELP